MVLNRAAGSPSLKGNTNGILPTRDAHSSFDARVFIDATSHQHE
jgi:hypothetical protein